MRYIPNSIQSGVTLSFTVNSTEYLATEWLSSLTLRGPQQIDIVSTGDDTQFVFEVDADTTSGYTPGQYWYCLRVEKDNEVHQIEEGILKILPNLTSISAPYDGRNHVHKVIDAIEAVIEGRASKDQESYAINNRQLRRTPIVDLLKLRDRYKDELYRQQLARKSGSNLLGKPVLVRFG